MFIITLQMLEEETLMLLNLFKDYCELVWRGMNQFGILEVEKECYTDQFYTNMLTVETMAAVLSEKEELESVCNASVTQSYYKRIIVVIFNDKLNLVMPCIGH